MTEDGHDVTVVPTEAALRFVGAPTWSALSGKPVATDVWTDVHEVRHVRLGQQADLVVVAPATADLLARAAHGLAGDLLTTTLLTARCPVVLAPAMHTEMWEHPATRDNVETLRERGVHVIEPASAGSPAPTPGRVGCLSPRTSTPGLGCSPGPLPSAPGRPWPGGGWSSVPAAPASRWTRCATWATAPRASRATRSRRWPRPAEPTSPSWRPTLPAGPGGRGRRTRRHRPGAAGGRDRGGEGRRRRGHGRGAGRLPARAHYRGQDQEDVHRPDPDADTSAPTIELVRNPDVLAGLVAARGSGTAPVIVGFAAETGDADRTRSWTTPGPSWTARAATCIVANEVGADKTFGQDTNTVHILRRGSDAVRTRARPPRRRSRPRCGTSSRTSCLPRIESPRTVSQQPLH